MEKLPDVFSQYFLKEGVVHAVEQLAAVQAPVPAAEASGRARRGAVHAARPASGAADTGDDGAGGGGAADAKTPAGDTLRYAVGARARRFMARYFTDAQGGTMGERPG